MTTYTRKLAARRTIGAWKPAPLPPARYDVADVALIAACLLGAVVMAVYG